MVEVFKTNVENADDASMLLHRIRQSFANYQVNFDLEDCDRILRVKCLETPVNCAALISLISSSGFKITVLEDDQVIEFP